MKIILKNSSILFLFFLFYSDFISAQQQYSITDLGLPNEVSSIAIDINNTGHVIFESISPGERLTILWRDGDLTVIGGFEYTAKGINDSDQIVGYYPLTGFTQAFIWQGGSFQFLSALNNNSREEAWRINNCGQIAGWSVKYEQQTYTSHPVIWTNGTPSSLGSVSGNQSYCSDINNAGVAAGTFFTDNYKAFIYENGNMNMISNFTLSKANSINDSNQVVGYGQNANGQESFIYQNSSFMILNNLPGTIYSMANDINNAGTIAGYNITPNQRAVVWEKNIPYDLNELIPANSGWVLEIAHAINDNGWIVGRGIYNGKQRAFLLKPKPKSYWVNENGGSFFDLSNWENNTPPDEDAIAVFNQTSGTTYTVTFGGTSVATYGAEVGINSVTFLLNGAVYTIDDKIIIGSALAVSALESLLEIDNGQITTNGHVVIGSNRSRGSLRLKNNAVLKFSDLSGGQLIVGKDSSGTGETGRLEILLGCWVDAGNVIIGLGNGAEGNVLANGVGSKFTTNGLTIGSRGKGNLNLTNGALGIMNNLISVGTLQNSEGELIVDGNGTQLITSSAGFVIGDEGSGGMNIINGGDVLSYNAIIGGAVSSTGIGSAQVDGINSKWTLNHLDVGLLGIGILRIINGGTVQVNTSSIGPLGTLDVTGGNIILGLTPTFNKKINSLTNGVLQTDSLFISEGSALIADSVIFGEGGFLGGSGTFNFDLINSGIINPGNNILSAGVFNIDANYTQLSTGTLEIELGGSVQGTQYDLLNVSGNVVLAGKLKIRKINGFHSSVGETFEIITSSSVSGSFEEIIGDGIEVSIIYGSNSVSITVLVTSIDAQTIVKDFSLDQNYPNPFNPSTKISWQSPVGGHKVLRVFDVLGNVVAILVDEYRPAGSYEEEFIAKNLSSGIYFYELRAGEFVQTKKLILIK